jgi:hypothetical protein
LNAVAPLLYFTLVKLGVLLRLTVLLEKVILFPSPLIPLLPVPENCVNVKFDVLRVRGPSETSTHPVSAYVVPVSANVNAFGVTFASLLKSVALVNTHAAPALPTVVIE